MNELSQRCGTTQAESTPVFHLSGIIQPPFLQTRESHELHHGPRLERLDLTNTNVTDAAVDHQIALGSLRVSYLTGTVVSDAGPRD
jgi:hypothetical protein